LIIEININKYALKLKIDKMSKEDMKIIVVERDKLFGEEYFEGFKHHEEFDYEKRILNNLKVMRRGDAEVDQSHKQPIGYMLIVNPKTKKIFAYLRSGEGGENRLHGKWSWGVGGHIEPFDNIENVNPIKESMMRELKEEIEITGEILGMEVLGYVNYDTDDVGRVHFGILYLIEIDGEVKPIDSEIEMGGLMSFEELRNILDDDNFVVETWSEIAVEPLKIYFDSLE